MTAAQTQGTLRTWRVPDWPALELRVGVSFQHPYPRHWHEEFYLSAITGGAGDFNFRGTNHRAGPGTLVLIAPGEVHTHHDAACGRSFRSMDLPVPLVAELTAGLSPRFRTSDDFRSCLLRDADLFSGFLRLHRRLQGGALRLECESRLLLLFSRLVAQCGAPAAPAPRVKGEHAAVRRAKDYLRAHFHRSVSIHELAAISRLSPFHFHRVFAGDTGMPPHAYQVQLRLLHARRLLREGRSPADVAASTGFTDQSHFTRHFKRTQGVTPARYAARSKNVQDAARSSR